MLTLSMSDNDDKDHINNDKKFWSKIEMCKDGLLMMMIKMCNDDTDDDINDYINVDDENVNEKTSGARSGCARVGSCLRHTSHQGRLPGHRLPGMMIMMMLLYF